MKLIGLFLTLLGAVSIYCSHSNQNLLSQHLPTFFKYLGLVLLGIGFITLFASLPKVVAAFAGSCSSFLRGRFFLLWRFLNGN